MAFRDLEQFSPGQWFYDLNDQLKQHIYQHSLAMFAEGDRQRDCLNSQEAIRERQEKIREALLAGLGGLLSSETPLRPHITGIIEADGYCIEKVIFESRPNHFVTANLYIPNGVTTPTGAVLFLCGHHKQAKHEPEYQSVCQNFVRAGLIVLAQDPIGQGERFAYYEPTLEEGSISWGTYEHDYVGAQCLPLGDSLAKYFLHDAIRGVDYLCSRPEVDPLRIGVTGNSGGGTQASLLMMVETRLAAAAPATYIMNRETYLHTSGAQDAEQIWRGFSAHGLDHEDILLAMAPKPVRVLAVQSDFFPIEGTRRTVKRCRRLWELFGREGDIDLFEDKSTHKYTDKMAQSATKFFSQHLLDKEVEAENAHTAPFPPESLWCTHSGQVRGEIEGAEFVFEANQKRLEEVSAVRRTLPRVEALQRAKVWLNEQVRRNREPSPLNPRHYRTAHEEDLHVEMALWWAQVRVLNHAYLFRALRFDGQDLPVVIALWDGGTNCLRPHYSWLRKTCEAGNAVMVLDVSGCGALSPRPFVAHPNEAFYGAIHKLSTDLIFLNDSLVALRTWDVLCAIEMVEEWAGLDSSQISLYAHGREGIYGQIAAFLDSRIRKTEVVEGIGSYEEWLQARHYLSDNLYSVILPDALHYFDLPDLH
ncbi:xylan esterase [Armatimonadota bacterium]|nr:xylan esterase [Armatimonadota bacterium]